MGKFRYFEEPVYANLLLQEWQIEMEADRSAGIDRLEKLCQQGHMKRRDGKFIGGFWGKSIINIIVLAHIFSVPHNFIGVFGSTLNVNEMSGNMIRDRLFYCQRPIN